jgi:Zn-dependent peptidase ImmA (M78 family)
LRGQQRLEGHLISDKQLAELAGVQVAALSDRRGAPGISFALDENHIRSRIVLRSKWHEGRRFELARLLGDRIAGPKGGKLFPATRAYTYRQKMQRSFAAEFLSPFDAVDVILQGDYSTENQQDVAQYFEVSPLTIRTLLVNHGRLEREELGEEFDAAAA